MGHLEEGQALLRAGQPQEALKKFEAALDESDVPLDALLGAARAAALMGHVTSAVDVLQQARLLAPKDARVLRELYKLHLVEGQTQPAIDACRQLAELEPDSGEPLYQEGVALLLASDADAAQTKFEAALEKTPGLWQAGQALAKIAWMRGKPDEARARLEQLLKDRPTEPALANDLAALLLEHPGGAQGEKAAEEVLRPVIAAHPDDGRTAYNLALALRTRNRIEAQRFAELAAAQPETEIGRAARRLGDSIEAASLLLSQMGRS